ncbi:MAG: hypothetical protein IT305_14335 [Chloroflexi bacterium]|nr:hypothetical protein [Chloroflexota bacterium]
MSDEAPAGVRPVGQSALRWVDPGNSILRVGDRIVVWDGVAVTAPRYSPLTSAQGGLTAPGSASMETAPGSASMEAAPESGSTDNEGRPDGITWLGEVVVAPSDVVEWPPDLGDETPRAVVERVARPEEWPAAPETAGLRLLRALGLTDVPGAVGGGDHLDPAEQERRENQPAGKEP